MCTISVPKVEQDHPKEARKIVLTSLIYIKLSIIIVGGNSNFLHAIHVNFNFDDIN